MQPLAYKMRPIDFKDIVGQDHLIGKEGIITKMVDSHHIMSFILYGNPGCGKTTIAEATCKMLNVPTLKFNASTDNKDTLKKIIATASMYEDTIIIIDEIHRMKKDIQDYLLPSVESGEIHIIGLTTVNPYHAVNPAIRSRCNIYRLNDLQENDVINVLKKAHDTYYQTIQVTNEVYSYISLSSGNEIRTALNMLESLLSTNNDKITLDLAQKLIGKSNIYIDQNGDYYYDCLSGLQKSIRGSDVDASLHYLAVLIEAGDLEIINRRLKACAYEDIGMANIGIGPRLDAACKTAVELGYPECAQVYATIVIEMALSPKSNSAYLAVHKALDDVKSGKGGQLPLHLKNTYSFNPDQKPYLYPHDYPNAWVNQQYLPNDLINVTYYEPKLTSKQEALFKERLDQINIYKNKK